MRRADRAHPDRNRFVGCGAIVKRDHPAREKKNTTVSLCAYEKKRERSNGTQHWVDSRRAMSRNHCSIVLHYF